MSEVMKKRFDEAVVHCHKTFNEPEHKQEMSDLSPRFWVALLDLKLACESADWDELAATFQASYRQLGSPGDFGYGTPCGAALNNVYKRWGELCRSRKPQPA